MYENRNFLSATAFGFNYCWVKDRCGIYHDNELTNVFDVCYTLDWYYGNNC